MTDELKKITELSSRLVAETEERMRAGGTRNVLTFKMQLHDDCRTMKALLEKINTGRITEKTVRELYNAYIRLKVSSESIMNWTFDEKNEKEG